MVKVGIGEIHDGINLEHFHITFMNENFEFATDPEPAWNFVLRNQSLFWRGGLDIVKFVRFSMVLLQINTDCVNGNKFLQLAMEILYALSFVINNVNFLYLLMCFQNAGKYFTDGICNPPSGNMLLICWKVKY